MIKPPSTLVLPSPSAASSSSRWRSDILQPVVVNNYKNGNNHGRTSIANSSISSSSSSSSACHNGDDNDKGIIDIPWSGWYGFFFQISDDYQQQLHHHSSSLDAEREKTIMTHDDNISRTNDDNVNDNNGKSSNSNRFRLRVSWNNNTNDDIETMLHNNERFIPLPLTTNDRGTIIRLVTLAVGKLAYFSKDSRVCVVMSSHDDNDATTTSSTSTITCTPSSASKLMPQWQLVFQRHLGKTEQRSVNDTGMIGDSINGCARCFMCGLCGKTVSKFISMKQHQDFVHLKSTRTTATATETITTIHDGDPSMSINNRNISDATTTADDSSFNIINSNSNSIWTRPLQVLYQDDAMVVVVKPQGMAVMGSSKDVMTLQRCNLLMPLVGTRSVIWPKKKARIIAKDDNNSIFVDNEYQIMEKEEQVEDKILGKPRPAHRLDAATGGVLVVAKTQRVDCILKQIFRERKCHKVYRAIVHGKLMIVHQQTNKDKSNGVDGEEDEEYGICNDKVSGKPSTTFYKPLRYGRASFVLKKRSVVPKQQDDGDDSDNVDEGDGKKKPTAAATSHEIDNYNDDETDDDDDDERNDEEMGTWLTVVELKPITGRHHQLRRHLKGLGHAIVGDKRYGPPVVSSTTTATSTRGTNDLISTMEQNHDKVVDNEPMATASRQQRPPDGNDNNNDDDDDDNDTLSRLCLWAMEITFPHPVTGKETCVGMDEPAWIDHVLQLEQKRWEQMQGKKGRGG